MHVQIVLFDGFDVLDAIAPYEVFTAAAMYASEEITVELVSAEGERMVTSGVNQLKLQASGKLDLCRKGIILVPGAAGTVDDNGPDSTHLSHGRSIGWPPCSNTPSRNGTLKCYSCNCAYPTFKKVLR